MAVLVQFGEGPVALRGGPQETAPPLRGSSEELARALLAFRAEGITHIQLVVHPITVESIERLEPVVGLVHAGA